MNATQTAQSLLSLPLDASAPDPYTVLGLMRGESDRAKIDAAIKTVIARLNAAKAAANPKAWNQAALWVKESRRIVSDPALKARLDQKLVGGRSASRSAVGAVPTIGPEAKSPLPSASQAPAAPAIDPLAAFLPGQATSPPVASGQAVLPPAPTGPPALKRSGDAVNAAFRPGNVPAPPGAPRPPGAPQPPGVASSHDWGKFASTIGPGVSDFRQPIGGIAVAVEAARELGAIGKPPSPVRRRKKRFPWASLILVAMMLVSIGGIVALMVYLNKNPAGITIPSQPSAQGAVRVPGSDIAVAPPSRTVAQPVDPVMGRLGPVDRNRSGGGSRGESADAADQWLAGLPDGEPADGEPADGEPSMANKSEKNSPSTESPKMIEPPGATEPAGQQLEAAQAALRKARQVIANAKWDQMNAAAEAAVQAAATQEQKLMAQQLVQLAELATYYHTGVEQALDGLKAAETFNVTDQLQISVVEITPAKVTLRFNGRDKDYVRSELPLVVAHKIVGFTIPVDSPATKAAAQAYQSLAPVTTPQYREQAIKALQAMPPQPDDVDPADLVAAIRQVYPD